MRPGGSGAAAGLRSRSAPIRRRSAQLFEELVETNTTLSSGSCTLAAERMAARLKAAGFTDSQLTLFATPEHPKEGGLVAVYPGTSSTVKPLLLIAHIDVVEAKREDWERDPFTLFEENGYFYARGTCRHEGAGRRVGRHADPLQAAEATRPKRTVKVALTCGEETNGAFNGVEWLAANRRDLIDAEFALNEGGGGDTDGKGKVVGQSVQIGEKTFANYRVETRNPGGHSSAPVRDNAIYQLSRALVKIDEHEFPLEMNDTTRRYLQGRRRGARRRDRQGDGGAGGEPARREGRGDRQHRPLPPFQPAHDVRGDAARRRPRRQRAAAARRRQRQLPHLPGPFDRGDPAASCCR